MKQNKNSKILVVKFNNDKKDDVIEALKVNKNQVEIIQSSAKEFFENQLTREFLMSLFPKGSDDNEVL